MQNSQNQNQFKSLRNRESTYTKHSEAFSIDPSMKFTDVKDNNFELSNLKYNPMPMFGNQSYGMPLSMNFAFVSNPFGGTTIADQLLGTMIPHQSNMFQALPLMRIAAEGMRIVCEIDILMLRHYYTLREQIFQKHNQSSPKRMDPNESQIEWIKGRFQYRYKEKISRMLCRLVDEVKSLLSNKQEDDQIQVIDKLSFDASELQILDKELKKDTSDYLSPNEVITRISKLIEKYIKGQEQ